MIQANGIVKAYGGQVIFDRADFSLGQGERVGLVGRNGSGKTTLLRMILGEERPDEGTLGMPRGYRTGHLAQHISMSAASVLEEARGALPPAEDGRDEGYRAEAVLMGLGFDKLMLARHPDELSGGYQVRLAIAKALLTEPDLLLLDEPTNYLDILSIRWLGRFLRAWRGELVLVTHDRAFMDHVTTHTMVIHRGKMRKALGSTGKLYDMLAEEEDHHERARVNEEKRRRDAERFIDRFRAQATKARAVQSRIKALDRRGKMERLEAERDLDFRFPAEPFIGKSLLEAEGVGFSYSPGGPPLIEGISLLVGRRDRIAVVGKNGAGKSTLLRLLAGELRPTQGTVSPHARARLAYFGQTNVDRLDPEKSVEEEILDAQAGGSRRAARAACGAVMFSGDLALKKIRVLSGGERSRVLLGRLLVQPSNLLLLDEPTNHLDMQSVDSLIGAVGAFEGAAVIVTHNELLLEALAERLVVFDGGRVRVFEGTYSEFLSRVGWEGEPAGGAFSPQRAAPRDASRREARRERAAAMAARSRSLAPLKKRIEEMEAAILVLENDIEGQTGRLICASEAGDAPAIASLSRSLPDAQGRARDLFEQFVALSEEHDRLAQEFDARLAQGV